MGYLANTRNIELFNKYFNNDKYITHSTFKWSLTPGYCIASRLVSLTTCTSEQVHTHFWSIHLNF